jgi:succinyl-diaminopimelate desuccinylase
LGENAVLKSIDVFRTIESLSFSRESSDMFDRPSINLGRIRGGDALNKVPDECVMAVDIRYLPGQDPNEILDQVRAIPGIDVTRTFIHPPVRVSRANVYVQALREAAKRSVRGEAMSVGREGASDAAAFLAVGIPAVEFGPEGDGHHSPDEWVSVSSLARYRRALGDFIRTLPMQLEAARTGGPGTAVVNEGGLRAIRGGRG